MAGDLGPLQGSLSGAGADPRWPVNAASKPISASTMMLSSPSTTAADGVGLLRIEQLYFSRPVPPTEDELCSELESLLAPLGARPVTIRLLDIGGDKPLPYLALPATANPRAGSPRRALALELFPVGPNATRRDPEAFARPSLARPDSDGHTRRRHSPDAGNIRVAERGAPGDEAARVWRHGRDAGRGSGDSRALEAR